MKFKTIFAGVSFGHEKMLLAGIFSEDLKFLKYFQKVCIDGSRLNSKFVSASWQMSLRLLGVLLIVLYFCAGQQAIGLDLDLDFGLGLMWSEIMFAWCLAADDGFEAQSNLSQKGIFWMFGLS
jgi:hypothetical protein